MLGHRYNNFNNVYCNNAKNLYVYLTHRSSCQNQVLELNLQFFMISNYFTFSIILMFETCLSGSVCLRFQTCALDRQLIYGPIGRDCLGTCGTASSRVLHQLLIVHDRGP